ncbi:MAG: NADP-dependent malic enzyme, partial [Flavobacteriaceae bacterium]|nr:NADP-dependent malic enzyme [Flavobacteriaceae bacterium]
KDPEAFIQTVKNIAPTFGGINLEDIKAPEAFEIERRLIEELDIPVMHDDQHGTAIISAAALLNAVELAEKNIDQVKLVINGAGAAAISCSRLYKACGVKPENIIMCDSKGVISTRREALSPEKEEFALDTDKESLADAMVEADVFVGLSVADVVTPEMILSMAKNPIVFAMANPNPEIDYKLACSTRDDLIMATGRSDYPNQVNNVLGFPYIFRGALDVRAKSINEAMKMAAVKALAELAKEPVPEQVNIAYSETRLSFGKDYIIPKPFDPRLIATVPPAVAKAAVDSGVALHPIEDWEKYEQELLERMGNDNKLVRLLINRAKINPKKVVFAEADHINVLKAAQIVYEEGIGIPILLGRQEIIKTLMDELEFESEDVQIIDPKTDALKHKKDEYAKVFWEKRRRDGITLYEARRFMRERNYYAAMMVNTGDADALITGYTRSYASVIRPILQLIGMAKGVTRVAATNLMVTERGPLFLADTTININPGAKELAKIAQMTGRVIKLFGLEPNIAMISYANFGASEHEQADKVKQAVKLLHKYYPDLNVDGELQADFALNSELLSQSYPFSKLSGKKTNGLIFPNLESANSAYKLIKELQKADSIGPIIMGMKKPVHILQMGASVDEIVNMAAVAVVDAQQKEQYRLKHEIPQKEF